MLTESVVMAKKTKQDKLNEAMKFLKDNHYVVLEPKYIQADFHRQYKKKLSLRDCSYYWQQAYDYNWINTMESMDILQEEGRR